MNDTNDGILRPAELLSRAPLSLPDGEANPSINGKLCPAALREFEQAELAPQELETFVEALRRLLPMQESGEASERYASAVDESLNLVARLLNKEPNRAVERWALEFVPFIESDADVKSAVAHFQSTLALYTAVIHLKHPEG